MAATPKPRRRKKRQPFYLTVPALFATLVLWPLEKLAARGKAAGKARPGRAAAAAAPRRRVNRRRALLLAPAGCVAFLALFLVSDYALSRGVIHRNVTVYGADVGGLTPRKAKFELGSALPAGGKLRLLHGADTWDMSVAELHAHIDSKAAAQAAYRYTRTGNYFTQGWRRFSLLFTPHDLRPPIVFDRPVFVQKLRVLHQGADVKPKPATVEVDDARPAVHRGEPGRVVDEAAVSRLLAQAAVVGKQVSAELPMAEAPPPVSDADAQAAARTARVWLSGPLTLAYEDHRWTLTPAELGQYLAFVPQEGEPRLRVTFDSPVTAGYFDYITEQVGKPGKDAAFEVEDAHVSIVPGTMGYGVMPQKSIASMEDAAAASGGGRVAQLVFGKAPPILTVDDAKAMHITTRIGTYTTLVGGTANRLNNVGLGAELLDDTLIAPGKVFSINQTTGERTAAKGFKMAPVIIQGKLEDSIGGGMCQVSTTVFNAAFLAGLQIVERHNHDLCISHYPLARDATVSYGSFDLRFRNDTPDWILLKTDFTGWSLTVSLYSAPLHRKVTSAVSAWSDVVPYTTKKKKTTKLAVGETEVDMPGSDGGRIECNRKVYEDGKLLWNDLFVSVYDMGPEVVLVGVKPKPEPSKSPKPTPKPSP